MVNHAACPGCARSLTAGSSWTGAYTVCPDCGDRRTSLTRGGVRLDSGRPTVLRSQRVAEAGSVINYRVVSSTAAIAFAVVVGLVLVSVLVVQRSRVPPRPERVAVGTKVKPVEEPPPAVPEEEPGCLPAYRKTDLLTLVRPAAPEQGRAEPVPTRPILGQRLSKRSDEDLRKDLLLAAELKLDVDSERATTGGILSSAKKAGSSAQFTLNLLDSREDLAGLPLRRGDDCQLGKEPAENLLNFARKLRTAIAAAQEAADPSMGADLVRKASGEMTGRIKIENGRSVNFQETAIPTLMQMLCVENQPVRLVLVEYLSKVDHPTASEALAKMALYDLSATIRAEAIRALSPRPRAEFRAILLKGLRYPWAPVAEHAAEALIALGDRETVRTLKELANEPDPSLPYYDRSKNSYLVREVVRINHLSNCLMCHAPSEGSNDLVRGRIPTPGFPLAPTVQQYEGSGGNFVRAEVTYLRQDFSVIQPVDRARPWPTMQRFDYLVRSRPISLEVAEALLKDAKKAEGYPQRNAVLYALKHLEAEAPPPTAAPVPLRDVVWGSP